MLAQRLAVAVARFSDRFLDQQPLRPVTEKHHRLRQCLARHCLECHAQLKLKTRRDGAWRRAVVDHQVDRAMAGQ
jgi:hypothetical protein